MTSTAASSGCSGIWPPGTPSRWGRRWTSSRAMPPSSGWTDTATCSDRWSMPSPTTAGSPSRSPATSARPAIASCVRWGRNTPGGMSSRRRYVVRRAMTPRTTWQPWPAGHLGRRVESTYLHVLDPAGAQENPVLEWVRGTGLRPVPRRHRRGCARHTRGVCRGPPPPTPAPRSAWSFPSENLRCRAQGGQCRLTVGLRSRPVRPFHARLTKWAATSSFFTLLFSSHH